MPPQRKNGAQSELPKAVLLLSLDEVLTPAICCAAAAAEKVVDKSGLGRAIINRKARQAQAQADPLNVRMIACIGSVVASGRTLTGQQHTTELAGGLHSVTQEDDLAEFLNTAALADTSFEAGKSWRQLARRPRLMVSAEKQNVKVISSPSASAAQHNPFLLTAEEERELREKHIHNQQRLRVPRRPAWDKDMKVAELERRERDSFLDWRRGLAEYALRAFSHASPELIWPLMAL